MPWETKPNHDHGIANANTTFYCLSCMNAIWVLALQPYTFIQTDIFDCCILRLREPPWALCF